jgi:hypothetical protein
VRITKAHDQQVLEVLHAIEIPEEQIAVLLRESDGIGHLTNAVRFAISSYAGMRDAGFPVYEGDTVVKKPEQPSSWADAV